MPASLQSIAKKCGVSIATVSRAMAGRGYVRAELKKKIQREATRLGYKRNHLVGDIMAHVRNGRSQVFVGNLAIIHVPSPSEPKIGSQLKRIIDSTCIRAAELGFHADLFTLGSTPQDERALTRVLRARGVGGALFVYPGPSELPHSFPWEDFSSVALDYAHREIRLNTICHDHFSTLKLALARLTAAGYRRIGLFIERFKDERTDFRWSAAFQSFHYSAGGEQFVPLCSPDVMTEAVFLKWYRQHRPDVVIGHFDQAVGWLKRAGVRVPRDVGFFSLNWEARSIPCAGVDPQLELQGRLAAEALINQLRHGERGVPAHPQLMALRGRLVDGPTVRGTEMG
ncbi:MAG TPA: LacI family DNA-binding transcriptional regulator [Opitutaceae bacterium]|nr:LacI family DNA-binding transcriptional regulator [Opitutaceae bacterium]